MTKGSIIAVIPARLAASRFPGKPLAKLLGLPMIEHVRRRVALCKLFSHVVVATCDRAIMDAVSGYGGRAVMTSSAHERCTDRVAEAAMKLEADIVVNVQGDEPLVRPDILEKLVAPLLDDQTLVCTNIMSPISDEEWMSPNVVKTVFDSKYNALYFSRAAVPAKCKAGGAPIPRYKQTGLIAFRKDFLLEFTRLPPTPLEKIESVDMLRVLEHGHRVRMVVAECKAIGVDTPADVAVAEELLRADPLTKSYL